MKKFGIDKNEKKILDEINNNISKYKNTVDLLNKDIEKLEKEKRKLVYNSNKEIIDHNLNYLKKLTYNNYYSPKTKYRKQIYFIFFNYYVKNFFKTNNTEYILEAIFYDFKNKQVRITEKTYIDTTKNNMKNHVSMWLKSMQCSKNINILPYKRFNTIIHIKEVLKFFYSRLITK